MVLEDQPGLSFCKAQQEQFDVLMQVRGSSSHCTWLTPLPCWASVSPLWNGSNDTYCGHRAIDSEKHEVT